MNIIVFIDQEENIKKIQSSQVDFNNLKFIGLNEEICKFLKKKKYNFESLENYGTSNHQKEAFIFLKKISESKIEGDEIKELLKYENLSLWNFISSSLYSGVFYHSLPKLIKYSELIAKCIKKENPSKVIYFDDDGLVSDIISTGLVLDEIEKIKIVSIKKKLIHRIKIKSKQISILIFLFWSLFRKYYYLSMNFTKTKKSNYNDILMFSGDQLRIFYNPFTKVKLSGDPYYEYLFDRLSIDFNLIFIGFNTAKPSLALNVIKDRASKKDDRYIYMPFEAYYSLKTIFKSIKSSRIQKKQFLSKFDNVELNENFIIGNISLYNIFKKIFDFYLSIYIINLITMFETCKKMLNLEKPSLTISSESGIETLCLVAAAKQIKLPNIGIQHGVLSEYNPTYVTNDDFMFPDFTLVGGEHWKNLIVNHSRIQNNRVIVTGIPRYDLLAKVGEIYNKKDFYYQKNISTNYKIILWTADFHSVSTNDNISELKAVFEIFSNYNDILLIIKPHPGDTDRQINLIEIIAEKYKTNFFIISKDSDTYELLYISDLLLTRNSTTALEAAALNKPIIIMNFNKDTYNPDYVKEGIALGAYTKRELDFFIKKVLKERKVLYNKEKYQKFVHEYFFELDGNATNRVVNFIKNILDK